MSTTRTNLLAACFLATLAGTGTTRADTTPSGPAETPLQLEWDARLRHEQVDDDAFQRDARADTLRLRLGLRAQFGHGWSGLLEGAGVVSAGEHYNSGANGQARYPGITDPHGGELNQAWLAWQGETFGTVVGRQRLLLDNQRWIGNSGWRQYEQTFDAVTLQWRPAAGWALSYSWLDRVHRVAGPDALSPLLRERRLDTHLFHVAWTCGRQQWTGYAYLHEDRDVASASTGTYGVRWTGQPAAGQGFGWTAEVARQDDYANNPQHFSHSYWLVEPTFTQRGITAKVGWEHLGGNGHHALQTPLATLHAFNGWDDQFNVTPAGGLEDRYAGINGRFGQAGVAGKLAWVLAWHDYRADRGGRYGREWNASLGYPLAKGLSALLKVADYRADGYGRDSAKLWLQLEWHGVQALAAR